MLRLSKFDFDLPEELIAQTPLENRAASRMLCLDRETGSLTDSHFSDLPNLLRPGDLLVVNNACVTALRLFGTKRTGGKVEVLLMRCTVPGTYECLLKPSRRLPVGTELEFGQGLTASVLQNEQGLPTLVRFADLSDLLPRLEKVGQVPLPPYIHESLVDPARYQTIFAQVPGSAAAPTAGLHFTEPLLKQLEQLGVGLASVTLDVGLDTFRPVGAETADQHTMHGETCSVPPETAAKVAACKGRVVAVGTTAVRTLESFAQGPRKLDSGSKRTTLFIQPGFKFQVIDAMLTNFHLPRTTMLLMISALSTPERVMNAYSHAVRERYRFLSFGDAMLIA